MKLEVLEEYRTRSGRHVQILAQFNSDMGPKMAGIVTYPDGTQSVDSWGLEGNFFPNHTESSLDIISKVKS